MLLAVIIRGWVARFGLGCVWGVVWSAFDDRLGLIIGYYAPTPAFPTRKRERVPGRQRRERDGGRVEREEIWCWSITIKRGKQEKS